jgi:protein TonB
MKNLVKHGLLFVLICCGLTVFAQQEPPHLEVMPEFPGGQVGWATYLQETMRYPPIARENNISGKVQLSFIVEKDGSLSEIKVLQGIGGGCDEEAVRVLMNSPQWKPGIQDGKLVRVIYTIVLNFKLTK